MQCSTNESSPSQPMNMSYMAQVEGDIRFVMMDVGVRTVCGFGVLGNLMTFLVLSRQKMTSNLTSKEKSAHIGLMALSVSDFMFCLLAISYTFLPGEFYETSIEFYFRRVSPSVITCFIITSTWLIVVMACERYIAVCHPLKAMEILSLRRTRMCIAGVYVICAMCSIAVFFDESIIEKTCGENITKYDFMPNMVYSNNRQLVWSIMADLIPCVALFYLNACLIQSIHKSRKLRRSMAPAYKSEKKLLQPPGNNTNKYSPCSSSEMINVSKHKQTSSKTDSAVSSVTATLIAVVFMFLVFVMPSEIAKFVISNIEMDTDANHQHVKGIVYWITNFMQAVNFSFNFILYCAVNKSFRRTAFRLLQCKWSPKKKFPGKNTMYSHNSTGLVSMKETPVLS